MCQLADRLIGIYKTDNATKSVTINPELVAGMCGGCYLTTYRVTPVMLLIFLFSLRSFSTLPAEAMKLAQSRGLRAGATAASNAENAMEEDAAPMGQAQPVAVV